MEKRVRELGLWRLKLRYNGGMEKLSARAEKDSWEVRDRMKPVIERAKRTLDSEAEKENPNANFWSRMAKNRHLGKGFLGGGSSLFGIDGGPPPFKAKAEEIVLEGRAEAKWEILKDATKVDMGLGRKKNWKILPVAIVSVVCTVAGALDAFATWLGKLLPGTGHDHLIRIYNEFGGDDFWNPDPGEKGYGLAAALGVLALVYAAMRRVDLKEAYIEAVENLEKLTYRGEEVIRDAVAPLTEKIEAEKDKWVEKFNPEKKK